MIGVSCPKAGKISKASMRGSRLYGTRALEDRGKGPDISLVKSKRVKRRTASQGVSRKKGTCWNQWERS